MIHYFSRLLAPAIRYIAAGLIVMMPASGESFNPKPGDCCDCLEIKFSGVNTTGSNATPGQQPQFAVNTNGTVDMQVSVILTTTGPACTGVQVKKITVKDPTGGNHQDIALAPVVDPVAGKTTYSGTISVLQTVLDELGTDGWRIVVTTECPGSTIGTQECGQDFNFGGGGGGCNSCGSGASCGPTGMPMFNNNQSTVGIPTTDSAGGDSSGFLRLDVGGFANPGRVALYPLVPSNFTVQKDAAGLITSVNTGANILDIAPADAALLAQDPNAFTVTHKTAGGQAFRTTTIAKVNEGGIPRIRMDSTFDGATYRSEQTNPQPGTVVLDEGRIEGGTYVALRRSSHAVDSTTPGVKIHRDIIQERATSASAWQAVSDIRTRWENQIHGWVKTEQVVDPDGAALTSTWTYYQPGEQSGPGASIAGLGKLKSYQRYGGYQEFHTYALNTETTTSNYADNPAGQVDATTWNPAARTRTRTTTIGGVEVSRTVTTYTDTSVTSDVVTFGSTVRTVTGHMPGGQDFGGKPSVVTYPDGTGTTHSYSRDASGARTTVVNTGTAAHGTRTTTTTNSRGTVILRTVQDIVNGNVNATIESMAVTAVDTLGRATATAWHPTAAAAIGEVASATGAAWTTTTSYNCCGIASETDRTGITTFNAYDALQRPVKTNRLGVTVETVRDGLTTISHRYPEVVTGSLSPGLQGTDATRIAKNVSNLAGTLQESWTPDVTSATPGALVKTATVTTYNANGSVSTQTNPFGGTVITESHPDGKTKFVSGTATIAQAYTYGTHTENGNGTVTTITTAGGVGGVTAIYADKSGRVFKTTRTAPHGQTAVSTTTYNTKGQAEVITSSGQPSVKYLYNAEGERIATWTDRNGDGQFNDSVVNGVKDACTTSTSDWLAASSAPVGIGTCQRNITTVRTDADEDKILSTSWQSSDGLRTCQESLGVAGATTSATVLQGSGATTTTQLNPDGTSMVMENSILANGNRQTTATRKDSTGATIETNQTLADVLGRTIQSTNGRGHVVQFAYTANGDQLAATTQVNAAPGGGNLVTSQSYALTPGTGTLATTTLPDGSHQYHETNLLGQTTRQWGSQTNPVSKSYDAAGRMVTHTTYRAPVGANADTFPSIAGDTTQWVHDASGVLLEKIHADGKKTTYTYDIAGHPITRTWARGIVTTYSYTAGKITSIDYSDSTPDVATIYDRMGQVVNQTNGVATTAFAYDANFRLDTETVTIDPDGSGPQPAMTRILDRGRDTLGRESATAILAVSGGTPEHFTNYAYDGSGRMSTVTSPAGAFQYAYLPNSNLIHTVTGPVHTVTNTWEPNRDVLTSKENKIVSTNTVASSFTYAVNPLNQRTSVQTSGSAFSSAPANWTWGYDPLGQVVSADSPTPAFDRAYEYDLIGNRKKAADSLSLPGSDNYSANPLNQYTAVDAFTPTYDDDGNQIDAQVRPLGSSSLVSCVYSWDGENRLVAVKDKATSAVIVSYTYDAGSRRVARTEGSNTTIYLYDSWNCVADYTLQNSSFTLQTSLTWGLDLSGTIQVAGGVGGLLAVMKNQEQGITNRCFPVFDGNGNVSEYLDAVGAVATHFEYDPFGRCIVVNSPQTVNFDYHFSTKPLDRATGLYYYGYRWYDPDMGRWINRDPIEEKGSVNLAAFAHNNAIAAFDFLGMSTKDCSQSTSPKWDISSATVVVYGEPEGKEILPDVPGAITGVIDALKSLEEEASIKKITEILGTTAKIGLDEANKVFNRIEKITQSTKSLVRMETKIKYSCCACDVNGVWGWGEKTTLATPIIGGTSNPFSPDDSVGTVYNLGDKTNVKALAENLAKTLIRNAQTIVKKCK